MGKEGSVPSDETELLLVRTRFSASDIRAPREIEGAVVTAVAVELNGVVTLFSDEYLSDVCVVVEMFSTVTVVLVTVTLDEVVELVDPIELLVFNFAVPKFKIPLHSLVSPRNGMQSPPFGSISGNGVVLLLLKMLRPA